MLVSPFPEVVKLVDAADSKSAVRDDVSVRVRPSGPDSKNPKFVFATWGFLFAQKNTDQSSDTKSVYNMDNKSPNLS